MRLSIQVRKRWGGGQATNEHGLGMVLTEKKKGGIQGMEKGPTLYICWALIAWEQCMEWILYNF